MGSTSTTVAGNWTVVKNANGHPTVVSGDDVEVFVNNSTSPFTGEAWSDIDLMSAIPAGATVTDVLFSLTVQVDGARDFPTFPVSPQIEFYDKADYLAGPFTLGYGRFGASGVGDLPDDNDPHFITYDNSVYAPGSGGAGIFNPAALAAALSNPSTPVVCRALGPGAGATGTGIWYRAPLTLTFLYDGGATSPIPPLQLVNRRDRFSSAPSLVHTDHHRQGGIRLTGPL